MRSIEGNFTVSDPIDDYLASFSLAADTGLSSAMLDHALGIHDKALDTVLRAPRRPIVIGEGLAIVETSMLGYVTKKGVGHVSLRSEVMLPFSNPSTTQIIQQARDEESPVAIVAGPTLRRTEDDRELFELNQEAPLRNLRSGESVLAGPAEVNYLAALIRKMRTVWGLETKNKK